MSLAGWLSLSLLVSLSLSLSFLISPLFGQGLDVKKQTCLYITLISKEFYLNLFFFNLSVCLSVSLSLAVCLSPHPQFPVCLSTLLCSGDCSSSVGQQLSVYKADTLERQSVEDFQRSPSILIPFFDADSSTLFLFSRVSFVDSV